MFNRDLVRGRDRAGRMRWLKRPDAEKVRNRLRNEKTHFKDYLHETYRPDLHLGQLRSDLSGANKLKRVGVMANWAKKNAMPLSSVAVEPLITGGMTVGAVKRANDRRLGKRKPDKEGGLGTDLGNIYGGFAGGLLGQHVGTRIARRGMGNSAQQAADNAARNRLNLSRKVTDKGFRPPKSGNVARWSTRVAVSGGQKLKRLDRDAKLVQDIGKIARKSPLKKLAIPLTIAGGLVGSGVGQSLGEKVGKKMDKLANKRNRAYASDDRASKRKVAAAALGGAVAGTALGAKGLSRLDNTALRIAVQNGSTKVAKHLSKKALKNTLRTGALPAAAGAALAGGTYVAVKKAKGRNKKESGRSFMDRSGNGDFNARLNANRAKKAADQAAKAARNPLNKVKAGVSSAAGKFNRSKLGNSIANGRTAGGLMLDNAAHSFNKIPKKGKIGLGLAAAGALTGGTALAIKKRGNNRSYASGGTLKGGKGLRGGVRRAQSRFRGAVGRGGKRIASDAAHITKRLNIGDSIARKASNGFNPNAARTIRVSPKQRMQIANSAVRTLAGTKRGKIGLGVSAVALGAGGAGYAYNRSKNKRSYALSDKSATSRKKLSRKDKVGHTAARAAGGTLGGLAVGNLGASVIARNAQKAINARALKGKPMGVGKQAALGALIGASVPAAGAVAGYYAGRNSGLKKHSITADQFRQGMRENQRKQRNQEFTARESVISSAHGIQDKARNKLKKALRK